MAILEPKDLEGSYEHKKDLWENADLPERTRTFKLLDSVSLSWGEHKLALMEAWRRNPEGETTRSQAVRLRRWPDDDDPSNPFWWQCYAGDRLVIYGHDAMRGLQDHRPRTLGLDTGCVYGGRLTGYLIEADRIVTVPSAG